MQVIMTVCDHTLPSHSSLSCVLFFLLLDTVESERSRLARRLMPSHVLVLSDPRRKAAEKATAIPGPQHGTSKPFRVSDSSHHLDEAPFLVRFSNALSLLFFLSFKCQSLIGRGDGRAPRVSKWRQTPSDRHEASVSGYGCMALMDHAELYSL